MTVPSSPVKLTDVITEFGPNGPSPAARTLTSYKKSPTGPYVGCSPNTTNIHSSPPITLLSFGGESKGNPGTFTSSTAGSGSISIPSGVSSFIIEAWGGGGFGGRGTKCTCCPSLSVGGGGGGAGGYSRTPITTTSGHWGQTFNYTVGSGGTAVGAVPATSSTITVGTFNGTFVKMISYGGGRGIRGCCSGGPGGSATGGIFTATGPAGSDGGIGSRGAGGPAYTGSCVSSPAGGAGGLGGIGISAGFGCNGSSGVVRFTWK